MSVKRMQGIPAYLEYVGETGNLKNHSCRGCRNYIGGVCMAKNAVISGYSDNNAKECSYFRNRYLNGKSDEENKKVTITKSSKFKDKDYRDDTPLKGNNPRRRERIVYKKSFNKIIRNVDVVEVVSSQTTKCSKCLGNLLLTKANVTVYSKIHKEDITVIEVDGLICERCKNVCFNERQYRLIKEYKMNRAIKVSCEDGFAWE